MRHARYLGVEMGLGAAGAQWRAVVDTIRARTPDIAQAPSRVRLFNVASLLNFKLQFVEADESVLTA